MNKLAVFVEGKTEALFVKRIVEEIAGMEKVRIEHRRSFGGKRFNRISITISDSNQVEDEKYYVLIMDCGGDTAVKSRIIEEHDNFTKSGYLKIIGMRDVYPQFTFSDIPKLEMQLPKNIQKSLCPVIFILAVMEIEAWFLAEVKHFQNIHPSITVAAIKSEIGFDPENDDLEHRSAPAEDLNRCYSIGGKEYNKSNVQLTIDALDITSFKTRVASKYPRIQTLVNQIEQFITS